MLKYASNTTNMWFHLQTHHHHEYAAMESQERARPASSGSSTSAGSSRIATANTSGIVQISDIPSAHITSLEEHNSLSSTNCLSRQIITGFYTKPACHTSIGVSASWGTEVLLMATSDRLPLSHPTKMEEPQTAVLPLLGLISVAY